MMFLSENGYDVHKTKTNIILHDNWTNIYDIENIKFMLHGIGQYLPINCLEFEKKESPNTIMLMPPISIINSPTYEYYEAFVNNFEGKTYGNLHGPELTQPDGVKIGAKFTEFCFTR